MPRKPLKNADNSIFWVLFSNIFEGLPRPFQRQFFKNLRVYYLNRFIMNLNFYFWVQAQKSLKTCINCDLKFQLFFLNLSSKFPAVVRTSKYPYMDICDTDSDTEKGSLALVSHNGGVVCIL